MCRILNHLNIQYKTNTELLQIQTVFATIHCEGTNTSKSDSFSNNGNIHTFLNGKT